MNIKRHRLGKLKRHRASPMFMNLIRQAQAIALYQLRLETEREATTEAEVKLIDALSKQDALTQKIEVQRRVIEKLERQIHEEPRW